MTTTGQDVRRAVRGLNRQPGFAVTAIVILGLGIGVNTAIFTIFNRFALQPLPVPDPRTIVRLSQAADEEEAERLSYPDYLDLREGVTTIRDLMAAADEVVTLDDAGAPAGVTPARFVSGNYAPSLAEARR
jgi:putative ABC transport system permease protein